MFHKEAVNVAKWRDYRGDELCRFAFTLQQADIRWLFSSYFVVYNRISHQLQNKHGWPLIQLLTLVYNGEVTTRSVHNAYIDISDVSFLRI